MNKNSYQKLFQNLIWPAVAGNVAWAFFSLIIEKSENITDITVYTRLIVLLLLAIYLGEDWLATEKDSEILKNNYWIGDAFHVIPISVFSIATYNNNDTIMFWSSLFVLIIPIIAHLLGCWELNNDKSNKINKRLKLAAIDASGMITFLILYYTGFREWSYPAGIFIIIVLWFGFRDKLYNSQE